MNVRFRRLKLNDVRHLILPLGLALILLLAAVTFLYHLGSLPHGFLDAEAANGLLARDASGHGGALPRAGSHSPLLAGLIALAGRPLGFDIFSARLGAAIAGIGAALFTALWLRRLFGAAWAVVGGLVLAGSFWFLLFSRVALSPIAGALSLSLLLWCLSEALARGARNEALFWYGGAGLAAGIGYISDPTMRIAPLLLLAAFIAAALEHGVVMRHHEVIGLLLAFLVALVVAGPFIRHATSTPVLLTFWTPTPGLAGTHVTSASQTARNLGIALAKLGWPLRVHPSLGLNLPNAPLLSGFVLPWAVIGLVGALRQARDRLVATGLIWGVLLLAPAVTITPVHPGRLLTLLPLLVALPVAGMRFLFRLAPTPRNRLIVGGLIVVMLAGNAARSDWGYFADWVDAPATSAAFSASISDSLAAAGRLPGNEPVLYSVAGHDDLRSYLAPDGLSGAHRRFDFDGSQMLPLPLESAGYLVVPDDAPVAQPLLAILEQQSLPELSGSNYHVYRLDERARQRLPLSVPTRVFADGTRFLGHQLTPTSASQLAVVLAWQLPADGKAHTVRVRLQTVEGVGATQTVDVTLPSDLLDQPYNLLRLVTFKAPQPGTTADLSIMLLDARGQLLTTDGIDADGYLFLNRYTFSR